MSLNSTVLPERLASVAVNVIEQSLVVPNLMRRESTDKYKGAANGTIDIPVRGYLPAHDISNWRAERSAPLTLDSFSERTISLTFGGNTYSGTKLQDEQKDYDLIQWSKVVAIQAEAVARNLERKAINLVKPYHLSGNPTGTKYEVTIGGAVSDRSTGGMRADLLALRNAANKMRMPLERRVFVCGTDIENAILSDEKIVLAQNSGDEIASAALREATIGRLFGFNVVVSPDLPADFGVLMVPDAYLMATAAPSVPDSIKFGATASSRGIAARWLKDYDPLLLAERSIVNLYNGFRYVTDVLYHDGDGNVAMDGSGDPYEYMIRAIAFDLDASADTLPVGSVVGDRNDKLVEMTGLGTAAE